MHFLVVSHTFEWLNQIINKEHCARFIYISMRRKTPILRIFVIRGGGKFEDTQNREVENICNSVFELSDLKF